MYLHLLLTERIGGFSDDGRLPKNIQNHLNKVTELTNDIQIFEKPGAELADNWASMLRISERINEAKNHIKRLEREVRELEEEKARCKTNEEEDTDSYMNMLDEKISAINNKIELEKSYISDETDSLKNKARICMGLLSQIEDKAGTIYSSILVLGDFNARFINYHNRAAELTDEIAKGCEDVKKLRIEIEDEIDKQSAESDNGFLMRIKAEINKLVIMQIGCYLQYTS